MAARFPMQANRGTIFVEDARLLSVQAYAGEQFVQRLLAPRCAQQAVAGSFVHIQCDPSVPMRRPLSIMRANAEEGWIEILYKVLGGGLRQLALKKPGDEISLIGPIGQGFAPDNSRPHRVLIGGGVGIPPMIFLAEQLLGDASPIVLMGSEIPFPFDVARSALQVDWLPASLKGTMPLLEDWGVVCRLASLANLDDSYRGYVTDLATLHLNTLSANELGQTELFACGPTPMLRAVATLAAKFNLPCQVSLEEFMACAVGGCAGCAVEVQTDGGTAMKRVCVDGPVFAASAVFFGD
jgi:dihydroorotate dehydrogenase electron transfer subunit